MKAASTETRALVVKAYTSGVATRKQLAEIFVYHIQSIGNLIRKFESEGRIAPRPKGHRKSIFTDDEKRFYLAISKLCGYNIGRTQRKIRENCSLEHLILEIV